MDHEYTATLQHSFHLFQGVAVTFIEIYYASLLLLWQMAIGLPPCPPVLSHGSLLFCNSVKTRMHVSEMKCKTRTCDNYCPFNANEPSQAVTFGARQVAARKGTSRLFVEHDMKR